MFNVSAVTPAYFAVLQMPVLDRRAFVDADITAQRHVAVVNEELARRFWPGQHAIGRSVDINTERHEVVGVVPRVTHETLADPPLPQLYVPGPRSTGRISTLLVRSRADGASLASVLRVAVQEIAPSVSIVSLQPLANLVEGSAREQKFRTYLIAAFAVLALGLAASGLYGTVAWIVHRRLHEFGVRLALGATPAGLTMLLLRQSVLTIGAGVTLGIVGSFAFAGVLRAMLFGVDPQDPRAFAWAAGTLVLTAFAATYLPACRAARVDPVQSLKME